MMFGGEGLSHPLAEPLIATQGLFYFSLTLFVKGLRCEEKNKSLWGKDAAGGLKTESHPSNY